MTTVTFTNSDISNAIVLTVVNANSPIVDVTIDSGNPYTTQALDLNKTYLLQLHKQGVVKSFFLIVTSNPFSCDLNDLFNTTPTASNVTFTNSDPSNAIILSVQDDQGNTVIDDVSVTNSNPYVDTLRLKLNATYSVHLKKEGASDEGISLTITSNPFTYDICTPFLNNAIVVFTNSDKSTSITLSVLNGEGVPVVSDVVVNPGNNPYITTLQLEETYKLLLVKGAGQTELSVTISSNPFSYEINTPFYAQVTFYNRNPYHAVSIAVSDGQGGYLIKGASVRQDIYTTSVLQQNTTYTLELREVYNDLSAQSSLTFRGNPFGYDVDILFSALVTFSVSISDRDTYILAAWDRSRQYLMFNEKTWFEHAITATHFSLNATYTLQIKNIRLDQTREENFTVTSKPFHYRIVPW